MRMPETLSAAKVAPFPTFKGLRTVMDFCERCFERPDYHVAFYTDPNTDPKTGRVRLTVL